jgi:acyl-CoA oxidase
MMALGRFGATLRNVLTSSARAEPAQYHAIDTAALTQWLYPLSPTDQRFRERVKTLLAQPEFAPREGLTMIEQAHSSYARFKRLRDVLGLRVRDIEQRPARLASALELIATIDGTLFTVMSIHYCLCAGSLLRHGDGSKEVEGYLDELDRLETIGTFLVTELGYGNNVVSLKTRADYDPETREIVLSTPSADARKFMPNTGLAGVPKLGVVMARLFIKGNDHGVFPVIVRLRDASGVRPGVSIRPLGDKPGYALDNAMTSFDGVRVPKHCLLLGKHSKLEDDGTFTSDIGSRRERFLLAIEQVQLGRLCLSAVSATAAAASAFIAVQYGAQRHTFAPGHRDVPILDYRNHQRDVFTAVASAYASRAMVNYAFDQYETGSEQQHDYVFRITSATKIHVSYSTERAIRLCRERCGAAGLFEENRVSVFAAQCPGIVTAEGDNQLGLIKIARQMLLRQGYEPPTQAMDLSGSLQDSARLLGLLRERERRLLSELRRAMAAARLLGNKMFDLWNENINLAIEAASAHASRLAA